MMKEYMDKTADIHFLRSQLPTLVRELEFWENNRSVLLEKNGTTYQLFAFATGGTGKGKFLMQKIQGLKTVFIAYKLCCTTHYIFLPAPPKKTGYYHFVSHSIVMP